MKKTVKMGLKTMIFMSVLMISFNCLSQSIDVTNKKEVAKWYKSGTWLNGCVLKASPSTNQEAFAKEYFGNKALWDKTFEWLKANDLNKLAPGRYVIEEGNSTATISEAPAPELDKVKWERHGNFNDIQYIITGKADMGISPLADAKETEAYDSKKDVAFYDVKGKFFVGEPGTFFIFTPDDVHRPGIKVAGFDTVKKLVIKVRAVK